jgi:hypothetical protein
MVDKRISFSQYQMWKGCPHRWKLNYVDKVSIASIPSIALVFGTAMHEALQDYAKMIYENSISEANNLDVNDKLFTTMKREYNKLLEQNNGVHFSNNDEMKEHYTDGVEIIKWFKSHRADFFLKKDFDLVGIETPINIIPVESHPSVRLVGFLDLVIRNNKTGKIYIYDFKTSTRGWGGYAKTDKTKISQLVLYKTYYAQEYNVDPDDIHVEYLILKRKVDQDAEYEAMKRRIQRFEPANGKVSQNYIRREVENFITTNFNEDGEYKLDVIQPPIAGNAYNNCRFCGFNESELYCPKEKRMLG